jgi:hypothetical protein
MCISARASVISFITNLFSCLALVKFGNANLRFYNYIIATFLIFVSLMQLVDFGIWIDLDCEKGYNKLASAAGVILIFLQPLVIVMAYSYFKNTKIGEEFYSKNIESKEGSWYDHINLGADGFNSLKIANIIYAVFLVISLGIFFKKALTTNPELLCTTPIGNNLRWKWFASGILLFTVFQYFYHIVALNVLAINPWSNYIKIALFVFYGMFFGTLIVKKYRISEIWCYLINFSALTLLIIQKIFPKQLA